MTASDIQQREDDSDRDHMAIKPKIFTIYSQKRFTSLYSKTTCHKVNSQINRDKMIKG